MIKISITIKRKGLPTLIVIRSRAQTPHEVVGEASGTTNNYKIILFTSMRVRSLCINVQCLMSFITLLQGLISNIMQ